MGFADVWNKTLVYFGIAEEDDWDEDGYLTDEELQRVYADRPNVRRLAPRRRGREEFDDWTDPESSAPTARTSVLRPAPAPRHVEPREPREARRLRGVESVPSGGGGGGSGSSRVHLVLPRSFNDAQQIADRFKEGVPVILNLQGSDQELAKRLIDFGSGLTYALDGGMQRVADKVFLLTPRNVEVSAEERARMLERGGFFNQQ
jgi:cell division inhibitor SepF